MGKSFYYLIILMLLTGCLQTLPTNMNEVVSLSLFVWNPALPGGVPAGEPPTGEPPTVVTLNPTTTVASETANNTSSSSLFTDRYSNAQVNGNAVVLNGNSVPQNTGEWSRSVSKISTHSLLYPGANTKIFAHYMGWFSHLNSNEQTVNTKIKLVDNARANSGHIDVGYNSYSSSGPSNINAQLADMQSRGLDGVIIDWYGSVNQSDAEVPTLKQFAEASGGTFAFGINIDEGAIRDSGGAVRCRDNSNQSISAEACLASKINYVVNTYTTSASYMRADNGNVEIHFFMNPSSINWSTVRSLIPQNVDLILLQQHNVAGTNGSFAWPSVADDVDGNCTYGIYPICSSDPYGQNLLSRFYTWLDQYRGNKTAWSVAYKGFDDAPVNGWNSCGGSGNCRHYLGQQCGMTWLNNFNQINSTFSASHPLGHLQLTTWDDYEEGTELETGIDNCVAGIATQISASGNLTFSALGGTDSFGAVFNEATINDYQVFASLDGSRLMQVADIPVVNGGTTQSTRTVSLANLNLAPGAYSIFVKAVGQPSIVNHLSQAVTFTVGQ